MAQAHAQHDEHNSVDAKAGKYLFSGGTSTVFLAQKFPAKKILWQKITVRSASISVVAMSFGPWRLAKKTPIQSQSFTQNGRTTDTQAASRMSPV